jgi:hypothetical protein
MELSLFLAKAIGAGLMLVAASMLVHRKNIDLLFEAYRSPSAVYMTGIVETFLGIMMVIAHNIWVADFRLIITLIGWMLLLRGAGRTFSPSRIPRMLERFRVMDWIFAPLLVAIFLIGAYLAYAGFTG